MTGDYVYRYRTVPVECSKEKVERHNKDFQADLATAMASIFTSDKKAILVASDGTEVVFNQSLLVLFSASLRSCLGSLSFFANDVPKIIVPDVTSGTILRLRDILATKMTRIDSDSSQMEDLMKAADLLGIKLSNLGFQARKERIQSESLAEVSSTEELNLPVAKENIEFNVAVSSDEDDNEMVNKEGDTGSQMEVDKDVDNHRTKTSNNTDEMNAINVSEKVAEKNSIRMDVEGANDKENEIQEETEARGNLASDLEMSSDEEKRNINKQIVSKGSLSNEESEDEESEDEVKKLIKAAPVTVVGEGKSTIKTYNERMPKESDTDDSSDEGENDKEENEQHSGDSDTSDDDIDDTKMTKEADSENKPIIRKFTERLPKESDTESEGYSDDEEEVTGNDGESKNPNDEFDRDEKRQEDYRRKSPQANDYSGSDSDESEDDLPRAGDIDWEREHLSKENLNKDSYKDDESDNDDEDAYEPIQNKRLESKERDYSSDKINNGDTNVKTEKTNENEHEYDYDKNVSKVNSKGNENVLSNGVTRNYEEENYKNEPNEQIGVNKQFTLKDLGRVSDEDSDGDYDDYSSDEFNVEIDSKKTEELENFVVKTNALTSGGYSKSFEFDNDVSLQNNPQQNIYNNGVLNNVEVAKFNPLPKEYEFDEGLEEEEEFDDDDGSDDDEEDFMKFTSGKEYKIGEQSKSVENDTKNIDLDEVLKRAAEAKEAFSKTKEDIGVDEVLKQVGAMTKAYLGGTGMKIFTNDGRNDYYQNDLGLNGQSEKFNEESFNRNEELQPYLGMNQSPISRRSEGNDSLLRKSSYEMENTPRGAAVSSVYNQLGWNESEMSSFINGEASKATRDLLNEDFNFLTPGSVNRLQDPYEMNDAVPSMQNLAPSPSFLKKDSPRQDYLKTSAYPPNYEMPEAAFGAYCPECQKLEPTASKLKEHLTLTHYAKEIRERYMSPSSSVCEVDGCLKDFAKNRGSLVRHIGSTHHKALEIMEERGIKIPAIFSDRKRSRDDFNLGDTKKTPEKKIKQEIKKEADTPLKKRFSCPECSASYMQPKPLENHMKKVHFN